MHFCDGRLYSVEDDILGGIDAFDLPRSNWLSGLTVRPNVHALSIYTAEGRFQPSP